MRAGLLVDHPCLPVPGGPVRTGEDGVPVDARRLPLADRVRVAAQLAAFAALLADFDLWPGRRALERAVVRRVGGSLRAEMATWPVPMLPILARMGGGEAAARRLRRAVVDAVAVASGVPRRSLDEAMAGEGFFLQPLARSLVEQLPSPLDGATARAMWAVRWSPPPVPERGELVYWSIDHPHVAARLAVALYELLRSRGERAWLRWPGGPDVATVPMPPVGAEGTLIVAGEVGHGELAAVGQWVGEQTRAVALGRLPPGWNAPRPECCVDGRLDERLALAGLPADQARLRVLELSGRFDPLDVADRRSLTAAAARRFEEGPPGPAEESPVVRLAALRPEGVPEGFLTVHAGLPSQELQRQAAEGGVSVREETWRVVPGRRLRPDPLHRDVEELYPRSDPRRLRHAALAGDDVAPLCRWAAERLAELDDAEVRRVLGVVEPGVLGARTQLLLAEACLSQLDLSGAREALEVVPEEAAGPWLAWLDELDPPPGQAVPGVPDHAGEACRAWAETGVRAVRRDRRRTAGSRAAWPGALPELVAAVEGDARRRIEVDLAAATDPARLESRSWRRRYQGSPAVWRQLVHRRALDLARRGEARAARRLLRALLEKESSPGRRGLLELDLGSVAASSREASAHTLRAVRLLQAAGFRHRTRGAVFNLAVCDLDELHVASAGRRLDDLASDGGDSHVEVERARLALAIGDEALFRDRLATLPVDLRLRDARFGEAVSLLEGVAALLDGRSGDAIALLERAGEEGRAWCLLAGALCGEAPGEGRGDDGWGVVRAARLLAAGSLRDMPEGGDADPREAFAHALVTRLRGPLPIDSAVLQSMRWVLEQRGCTGWATLLRETSRTDGAASRALTRLIEDGDLRTVPSERRRELLSILGVDGVVVRRRTDRVELVRWGAGPEGPPSTCGWIDVAPLGRRPPSEDPWRLAAAVIALLAPPAPTVDEAEVAETGLIGCSKEMRALRAELRRLGPTSLSVLLLGETGTGKEVAARALHRLSGRRGRFVAVNVAGVPGTLLEAELFGAVRGAYTGAAQPRRGLVDAADGGTLLLDEVGDLEPPLQVKLLRFLESQEVRPVGADRSHPVDVRVVSATHRDLAKMIADGRFRSDLYYRINGVTVRIPPLRERREDIPALRDHFQEEGIARRGLVRCRWSAEAESLLTSSSWPGNARQLRHVVEEAMARSAGGVVTASDLPLEGPPAPLRGRWEEELDRCRRDLVEGALDQAGGNRSAAARQLGISRQSLLYHIKRLAIR